MTETIQLAATLRQTRITDLKDALPAVMYGSGIEATSLGLKRNEFEKVFAKAGESGLIALTLDDGREMPVIIKDLQFDAMKNRVIHVDFYKVNMDKEVEAEVSVNFIGESPAVKAHGAIIVQHLDQLHIECLPGDLIQKIDVDMSALKEIGDTIHVSDIPAMKGITIKNDANEIIVNAVEPQKEVEAAPAAPAEGEAAVPAADAAKAEGEEKAEEKK